MRDEQGGYMRNFLSTGKKKISFKKISFYHVSSIILTVCMILSSTLSVLAAPNAATPTLETVQTESQKSAAYLIQQADYSAMSNVSTFKDQSRSLLLSIRSGYDCSANIKAYLEAVTNIMNADGTLNMAKNEYAPDSKDYYSSYAYLLLVLAVAGKDATNFNNNNIVALFNDMLNAASESDFIYNDTNPNALNPYHLGIVNLTIESYSNEMKDYSAISEKIKKALKAISTEKGINYWGYNLDNNAHVYSYFYNMYTSDSEIKNLIDTALTYTTNAYYDSVNGTFNYPDYNDPAKTNPNENSAALAAALYSTYNNNELSAIAFNTLTSLYQSSKTSGAYTFYGEDSIFTTYDALYGLVTYQRSLSGKSNPFDVSDITKAVKPPVEEDPNKPEEPTQDDSTVLNPSEPTEQTVENLDTEQTIENTNADNSTSPATGDSSLLILFITLGLFSLIIFVKTTNIYKIKKGR